MFKFICYSYKIFICYSYKIIFQKLKKGFFVNHYRQLKLEKTKK